MLNIWICFEFQSGPTWFYINKNIQLHLIRLTYLVDSFLKWHLRNCSPSWRLQCVNIYFLRQQCPICFTHSNSLFRHDCISVVKYNINKLAFIACCSGLCTVSAQNIILWKKISSKLKKKKKKSFHCLFHFLLSLVFFWLKKRDKSWFYMKCSPGAVLWIHDFLIQHSLAWILGSAASAAFVLMSVTTLPFKAVEHFLIHSGFRTMQVFVQ